MQKIDKETVNVPVVVSPVRLYWVLKKSGELFVVAATSENIAARIFQLHAHTLRRNGGVVTEGSKYPAEIDAIKAAAKAAAGTLFTYTGQWETVKVDDQRGDSTSPLPAASTGNGPVRTLKLTLDQKAAFIAAGGVEWLRRALSTTPEDQAIQATRRLQGERMHPVSMRLTDEQWLHFQKLGGKTWLLHQLSLIGSKSQDT